MRTPLVPILALALAVGIAPARAADDLASLLARGPVCLVETKDDGRVEQVTAIARLSAPIDVVWKKITDFGDYINWMPQVAESTVVSEAPGTRVVDWSILTPGPNVKFRASYTMDEPTHTVSGTWVHGALKGSRWEWRLVPDAQGTLVYRVSYSSAVEDNWLLSQFDDKAHTLELGLNAATPIVELQALQAAVK